jgi:hypothetical protein
MMLRKIPEAERQGDYVLKTLEWWWMSLRDQRRWLGVAIRRRSTSLGQAFDFVRMQTDP